MKLLTIVLVLALAACSIPRVPNTAQFYEQETAVTKLCLASLESMTPEARLRVDASTGTSPMTNSAMCYRRQMWGVVAVLNYPYAPQVENFSNYLVELSQARDRGLIDTPTALASYRQAAGQFRQIIANSDQRQQEAALRELGDRLQIFAQSMSGIALEQDRNRQANRPITCTGTGVYRSNGIVCN